jgi:nickel-dependent lactate racemase
MKDNTVKVPTAAWYGDGELDLRFPLSWEIVLCQMKGDNNPPILAEEIKKAFANPLDQLPIRILARNKKEVAILFDDISRPTQIEPIIPHLLEELWEAGVPKEGVRFIAALGAHGALNATAFRKKLGEQVVASFHVYNHNPFENCSFLGNTSNGTPININSEFMKCELKIGIGCIVPHGTVGFGGGSKIVLPGIASIETIHANHLFAHKLRVEEPEKVGIGKYENNPVRFDIEEAARMAGLQIKIDAIVNTRRETTALFIGDPVAEYSAGARLAKENYATQCISDVDVVVGNAYSKVNEAVNACAIAAQQLPERGGVLVVISNNPEGEVVHYLQRNFGKWSGGKLWKRPQSLPPRANKLILMTPFMDKASLDWFGPIENIVWVRTWQEVLNYLEIDYPNGAKVAVIPDATIQYIP